MRIGNDRPLGSTPLHRWAVIVGDVDRAPRLEPALGAAGMPWTAIEEPEDLTGLARAPGAELTVLVLPAVHEGAGPATRLLRDTARIVAHRPRLSRPRLWCVTLGASERPAVTGSAESALWTLGRTIGQELPDVWGGTLDLAPDPAQDAPALIAQYLDRPTQGEDVVAPRRNRACTPVVAMKH